MDKKPTGSIKKIGPIHLVYSGKHHIGNVIEPTIGGSREGAQHFTAISKFWGLKKTHDTKMAALQWLKQQHGEPMQMEAVDVKNMLHIHDYVDKFGNQGNVIKHLDAYGSHPNYNQKSEPVKYHKTREEAHNRMTKLGYKPTGESKLRNRLTDIKESKKKPTSGYSFISNLQLTPKGMVKEDPNWTTGNAADPEMDTVGLTGLGLKLKKIKNKYKKLLMKDPDNAPAALDAINSGIKVHENIINKTRLIRASLREELFDKDKNEKDPKAGPQIKKDDTTGDETLQIKRTATGKPGDIIQINPKLKVKKSGSDGDKSPENKKRPDPSAKG